MKHIISIGIDNANGLTPLGAAVQGAKDFEKWGKAQGYTTALFIDESKKVSQSAIFDEINSIVDAKTCETLIIFFSGHGILKSPSQEIWLLSDAKNNPNESINLTGSIDNARTSGIPYVVFISDACRILPNEVQFTGNGSVIFPISDDTNEDCTIDVLYATRPGNPALEQNSTSNAKKFGLFTQTLLEVLAGDYPELIKAKNSEDSLVKFYDYESLNADKNYKNLPNGSWHINTINSEASIKSIVAKKARDISISLKQNPDIRIQYQNPKPSLAEFDDQTAKKLMIDAKNQIMDSTDSIETDKSAMGSISRDKNILIAAKSPIINKASPNKIILHGVQKQLDGKFASAETHNKSFKSILQDIDDIPNSLNVYKVKSNLIKNSEIIYDSKGRQSFETQTGFTIVGTTIKEVITHGDCQIFLENNHQQIRIHPNEDAHSALVVLKNGNSIPVAILEGYIGTLVFDKNQLLTINYTPSRNSYKYQDFEKNENKINFVRAFVASAANEGFDYSKTFNNEFDKNGEMNFNNAGSFLRQEKSLDPSLGLYAVYAYRQAGKTKDLQSVYKYMMYDTEKIIFDIAMLAGMLENTTQKTAPFCPMISLGWAYLQKFEKYIHPEVLEASNHLLPSLWTTFDKKGTKILTKLFNQKQIL